MNNIFDNALTVSANFSRWRPRVSDKKISHEIAKEHGTEDSVCDFLKRIFPAFKVKTISQNAKGETKSVTETRQTFPELHAVLQTLDTLYVWHAANTLVWNGKGVRLLPAVTAEEHKAKFDEAIAKLPAMLDAMEQGYPAAVERAKIELNGMWKERDYPSAKDLRAKFGVSVSYDAIPQIVTSKLPASVLNLINSNIETRVQSAVENSMRDAWNRLYTCLNRFHKTMDTPGAIFRDSLVENLADCCSVLTRLNITGDSELEAMRAKAFADLAQYDPETLRDNPMLRAQVAQTADSMLQVIRKRTIVTIED